MARQEHPKEDLIADATALVDRAELRCDGFAQPIVVGFRRNGALSLFIEEERVYHFNTAGELRRAFLDGCLYKAANGQLVKMVRQRTAEAHLLQSSQLGPDAASRWLAELEHVLQRLQSALSDPSAGAETLREQTASGHPVAASLASWLQDRKTPTRIAAGPQVG